MANQYLKSVRTRFRNTLNRENESANRMFYDFEAAKNEGIEIDREALVEKLERCTEKIQQYREKLEIQSEKLASALSEKETEACQTVVDEDSELCDYSMERYLDLKSLRAKLMKEVKTEPSHDTFLSHSFVTLQEQMKTFMIDQVKQQKEFIDRQEKKEAKLPTVKLPKLEILPFNGNKLKWKEFWDSFECTVHKNPKLSNIEKFSYLQSKVVGEARGAIAGLALSNENYEVAINLLSERYGNKQEIVDLHYSKLINIPPPKNKKSDLRHFLDTVERHLRSLEVLKKKIEQDVFISMIKSKLPKDVLLQLELRKDPDIEWKVDSLRKCLCTYIVARERSEQDSKTDVCGANSWGANSSSGNNRNQQGTRSVKYEKQSPSSFNTTHSAEALVAAKGNGYSDKCRYCQNRHWSDECTKYRTLEERKKQLKDCCFKCLKKGHMSKECKTSKTCVHCGASNDHHRSLCPKKFPKRSHFEHVQLAEETNNTYQSNEEQTEEKVLISSGESVLMQTAVTEITNPYEDSSHKVRLLLDCGSQRTYITEKMADKLNLEREEETEIKLNTFGSDQPKVIRTPSAKVGIRLKDDQLFYITANIVPSITGTVQRKPVLFAPSENMDYLMSSLDLADSIPLQSEATTIELLLGNDYYLDIVLPQKIEVQSGLYFLSSKLGWILTGRTAEVENSPHDISMLTLTYGTNIGTNVFTNIDDSVPTKPDLEDFWNIESIGVTDKPSINDDDVAMETFRNTLKFKDKRYQVTWPWKSENPDLPQNRQLAISRLNSCLSKLKNKQELLQKYDNVIQDQLTKGVIEKVTLDKEEGLKHYLPHHAVINPTKTTTKLRVVYDASAKTRQRHQSLNECLYRGPVMLHDLCGILLRFRLHNVTLVADIEKAFLQIGLQPDQRDVTRFFWIKDCNNPVPCSENLQEFRFCRVPFGVVSSPFLLGATIEYHLKSYETENAETLKNDICVDNVITGTDTVGEAKLLYNDAKSMFHDASMNLRDWISNKSEVNNYIPKNDRADGEIIKVLGYQWDCTRDVLSVTPSAILHSRNSELTKRNVLKQLASVYDPLGFFAPVFLQGKIFLQATWCKNFDWDDTLDDECTTQWLSIKPDLQRVCEFQIPRGIKIENDSGIKFSLLCFCDASKSAYAAVVYLLQENNVTSKSDIVFAKTRLAPMKDITIPRLELMSMLIGVRCLKFVKDHLGLPINRVYLWSDSQCVLNWLCTEKSLSVFVENRVKEIKSHQDIKFGYTPSKENPADIASRGSSVQNLAENDLWWHGPKWLKKSEVEWPSQCTGSVLQNEFESEFKKSVKSNQSEVICASLQPEADVEPLPNSPLGIDPNSFSSLNKLIRVTALCLRFVQKLRKLPVEVGPLKSTELTGAETLWFRYVQKIHFFDTISAISTKKANNLQRQLGVFIDPSGILRCRGRLEHAELSEGSRFPILLPKNGRFTVLIIESLHKQNLHAGVSQTLALTRRKFWIPHGRATERSVLKHCVVCRRYEGGNYKMPPMAPLPRSRVSRSVPFSRTGLDYLGPLYIKTEQGAKKVWICLFTCTSIRAMHLELVNDMTTSEFLMALRRFIAHRGKPDSILSDNAAQFKAASKVVGLVWSDIVQSQEVQSYVSNERINWSFIVELAPWMGGFYERLVGLVKRALRKSLGRKMLTLIQLQTLLKEVEAVVNSRPLVYLCDDINSNVALTPGHFLSLNPKVGIPMNDEDDEDPNYTLCDTSAEKLLKIWKKGQKLLNSFWKLWRDEYLLSLRERMQTQLKMGRIQSSSDPTVGDIVVIKDDTSRGSWKMGKIVDLFKSRDGETRSAKVQISPAKVLNRPLNLLYPIEVSSRESVHVQEKKADIQSVSPTSVKRFVRTAALRAKQLIKDQL